MANEKRLDLIDRGELLDAEYLVSMDGALGYVVDSEIVRRAKRVEAVEVVHGYWIDSYNADHMGRIIEHGIDCSVCENVFKDDSREVVKRWKERFKACPFCGALMEGK